MVGGGEAECSREHRKSNSKLQEAGSSLPSRDCANSCTIASSSKKAVPFATFGQSKVDTIKLVRGRIGARAFLGARVKGQGPSRAAAKRILDP